MIVRQSMLAAAACGMTAIVWMGLATPVAAEPPDQAAVEFFEKRVRPVLVANCLKCHGPEKQEHGLRVDSLAALARGGESGPAIVPGKPGESLLISAINHGEIFQMPPKTKLPAAQIADVTEWVKNGAAWPDARAVTSSPPADDAVVFTAEQKAFWAFQKPVAPTVPEVKDAAWCRSPIDRFILAGLEAKGLSPAAPADKRTLLRRATFDLHGLPPTPEEVAAFIADDSPQAFERVVDRLLASPRFGERWGRHWLDVARYADSNGMDENVAYANAFRYRDYVVDAFNRDLPYDQFVREQIAGDLVAGDDARAAARLIATGFLVIGPKMLAEDDPRKMELDIIDEQLDTVGRTFFGLTIGCARCHDHKFDPLPTEDYYSLAGIFKSTKTMANFNVVAMWNERPAGTREQIAVLEKALAAMEQKKRTLNERLKQAKEAFISEAKTRAAEYLAAASDLKGEDNPEQAAKKIEQLANEKRLNAALLRQWVAYLKRQEKPPTVEMLPAIAADPAGPFAEPKEIERELPAEVMAEIGRLRAETADLQKQVPVVPTAMSATDGKVEDLRVHLRGNYLTPGRVAPRRFPRILAGESQTPIDSSHSGRMELAEWMTRPDHPLTSRVIVNRVWHWHFGNGIVRSTDNFGLLGERPDNQPLLDWLAVHFVEQGWSLKSLHRTLMLSSTYQMSTAHSAQAALADPENRLHWRHDRRRLEAEALRDAILVVSGQLDTAMGGTLLPTANHAYVTSTASEKTDFYHNARRSIYLPVTRSSLFDVFQAFDFADPSTPNGQRSATTVAPQALALMNSKLVEHHSRKWAEGLLAEIATDDAGRVRMIYERAYGRPPVERELTRALEFVRHVESNASQDAQTARTQAWQSFCRVVLASSEFVYVE